MARTTPDTLVGKARSRTYPNRLVVAGRDDHVAPDPDVVHRGGVALQRGNGLPSFEIPESHRPVGAARSERALPYRDSINPVGVPGECSCHLGRQCISISPKNGLSLSVEDTVSSKLVSPPTPSKSPHFYGLVLGPRHDRGALDPQPHDPTRVLFR